MVRRRKREKRATSSIKQLPWQKVRNPYQPLAVISDDHVETIVEAALEVLKTKGMRFLEPGSRRFLHTLGAEIDEPSMMVRFPPGICLLYTSPSPRDQRGSRMPSSA